jgi:acyl dehydratase
LVIGSPPSTTEPRAARSLEVLMPDQSQVGLELDEVSFPVERGKVREFARALHQSDPIHLDAGAAAAAGFAAIPAPLTFAMTAMSWRERDAAIEDLGFDFKRLLHGGTTWEYRRPLVVGDELTVKRTVAAVDEREGKRGGVMTFVTIDTDITDASGSLVARQTDTLIQTGAPQ